MGKKRSAARRAAATAAASAAPTSPAHPLDTTTAPVNTTPACDARELAKRPQPPRVSHEADAIRAPHAASPTHPTIDALLVCEPAAPDARANTLVALATPETSERETSGSYHPPTKSPPALDAQPSTSLDTTSTAARRTRVSTHENTPVAPQSPLPAQSALTAAAAADLATAVARIGPPDLYIASPVYDLDRLDARDPELDAIAPRTGPATSIEDIDGELLANIIEDAQRAIRIEARRDVRAKALAEGRERGWREGFEEGAKLARKEARAEARMEAQQRDRAWKDGYEIGRSDGYREGLEAVRTEVSTLSRADASVQADVSSPPYPPPARTVPTTSHVDASVQCDDPPLPFPLRANPPPPIPIDAVPASSHVNVAAQTDDLTPTHATEHTDAGAQAEPPAPPSAPDDTHSPQPRVQASAQTDAPRASTPARARTVHEIDHDLLREIIATASARGEAAGLKQGKHTGFQDGMEAGWKSGTREGREEGYRDGKKDGINEGYERRQLEVSRIPHAVAVVQTDDIPLPTDSTSRTDPARTDPDTLAVHLTQHAVDIPPVMTTTISNDSSMHNNDLSLSHNDPDTSFTTAHTHLPSFSWADEASSLPITCTAPLISPPPRDFSVLRSSSARPFDSLKRRARRSQPWPARLSHPSRPFIPILEPVITRRHPAGLRAGRPAVVVSLSSPTPHSTKSDTPPLDWQGDPRLQELSRVLRGLGWVRG